MGDVAEVENGVYKPHDFISKEYDFGSHDYGTNNEYSLSQFFCLFISLLLFSVLLSHHVTRVWKWEWFPEAAAPLLIGMSFASLSLLISSDIITDELMGFDPTIFFVYWLPPIIFHSGYSMKRRFFFANFLSILTFATVGTLVSTILFGIGLYLLGAQGWCTALSFAECLAFGALISATDPVSTLAIFQQLRVDPKLFYIIFGESVLNDAVSIVLFQTFSKFIGYAHSPQTLVVAAFDFLLIFVGSTMLGLLSGLLSALLFKHVRFTDHVMLELTALFLLAYLPFIMAEAAAMSGIVTILFAAITMKHYTHKNISPTAQLQSVALFEFCAYVAETAVFLNLGLSVVALRAGYQAGLITVCLLLVLLARAAHVYPLSFFLNACRSSPRDRLHRNQQHMLCFSGLRGAIAFALSLSFPGRHQREIIATTMFIVIFTVFFMGGATTWMLRRLRIKQLTLAEQQAMDAMTHSGQNFAVLRFDRRVLMPFFTRVSASSTETTPIERLSMIAENPDSEEETAVKPSRLDTTTERLESLTINGNTL